MKMMIRIALAAAVAAVAVPVSAQTAKAPRETATALLNGKKVAIEYGRPTLGGRKMAELLAQLPADRIWRAGENQATTLATDTDILVGGKRVPAGKYTVYVHAPATGDYSLVLNSDPGIALKLIYPAAPPAVADALWPRLDGYDKVKDKEVLRVPLKKGTAAEPMDKFLVALAPAKNGASAITLTWGSESWSTDIKAASPAR
jgi:DUF2911 family protein